MIDRIWTHFVATNAKVHLSNMNIPEVKFQVLLNMRLEVVRHDLHNYVCQNFPCLNFVCSMVCLLTPTQSISISSNSKSVSGYISKILKEHVVGQVYNY